MSKVIRICFGFALPFPVTSKTPKTNHDSLAHVFLHFVLATCIYFKFGLSVMIVIGHSDYLVFQHSINTLTMHNSLYNYKPTLHCTEYSLHLALAKTLLSRKTSNFYFKKYTDTAFDKFLFTCLKLQIKSLIMCYNLYALYFFFFFK